jgi:hypothetical protein
MVFLPDNLTICDVGDCRALPGELRHPDVVIMVYGGDEKKAGGDTTNFRGLGTVRDILMGQVVSRPVLVMLNLDLEERTVSRKEEIAMENLLGVRGVQRDFLIHVEFYRDAWIRYRRKRRPPDA